MNTVLMVASEAVPFAKTGGLADVLGALPAALGRMGWHAVVCLPRYRGIDAGVLVHRFPVQVGEYSQEIGFYEQSVGPGATAILVDCSDLYNRSALYNAVTGDYADNPRRFAMLALASLEFASRCGIEPTVIHAHDWQAGLVPVYMKTRYASDPALAQTPVVFTIHNLAYQGLFGTEWLAKLGLPTEVYTPDRLEHWGQLSFLKGGITYADLVTTVSPRYAEDIKTPGFGLGLDGVLRNRGNDLVGILNGIDTTVWDPARDPFLPEPFSADNVTGKTASKRALLDRYRLPTDPAAMSRPLFGLVSRMVDQKGFDLLSLAADDLASLDATFVMLGAGESRYENLWLSMAARFPDRIGVRIGFDEALAHLIEAGADAFLMPSQQEPCGLNQMYSQRYGAVPVVRAVGGLADTVTEDVGFVFEDYTPAALIETVRMATHAYEREPDRWLAKMRRGMTRDHSWDRAAREYAAVYQRLVSSRPPR
jgi:starch synthase